MVEGMLEKTLPTVTEWIPGDAERRHSVRYNCVGIAEILRFQKGIGKCLIGTIRKISVRGCNIETQSPLELNSRVAVTLQASALRVCLVAEIRSVKIHGQCSAGFQFINANASEVESLLELIAALRTSQRL
jgi:hypothetical protein